MMEMTILANPIIGQYDYNFGIDPAVIAYIRESHIIQSRISPTPCYLLQLNPTGSSIGNSITPLLINSYIETVPQHISTIWDENSLNDFPDLRVRTDEGAETFNLFIDTVKAFRVLDKNDLENDNEYYISDRKDLVPPRVDIIFNEGFDASSHEITYHYYGINRNISNVRLKEGENDLHSLFGWTQYLNTYSDAFQTAHQILIRLPLNVRDLNINEEGLVILEEKQSWMIWEPFVKEQDVIIIPQEFSFTGREERFEVVDKQNSVIQRVFVSQRFRLKHLEYADSRYKIPYVKV